MVYLSLRLVFHYLITTAGYFDGGMLSYDSYYPFAFAHELKRTGAIFLFQNPFGTLDKDPQLFNLYASCLLFLQPLFKGTLFAFDATFATLSTMAASFLVCRLLSFLKIHEKVMVLFGGGLGFIAVSLGIQPKSDTLFAAYWGLTYLLNQISTPEILYHFLFFFGLHSLFGYKNISVMLVICILTFLHPFTAITFNVTVFCAYIHSLLKTRRVVNSRIRYAVYAFVSTALIFILFGTLLPSLSRDAAYMKTIYEEAHFYIDLNTYALFLFFPALWCLRAISFARTIRPREDSEKMWIFLGTAFFCLFMSTSYLYTDRIVQPAHWSRVYPYFFLFGTAGLILKGFHSSHRKWVLFGEGLSLFIALADSALGVGYVGKALLAEKRPPLFLTFDQAQIIKKGHELPSGRFLYLRDGSSHSFFGDFEYALMSLTHQKGFAGHAFFSPFREMISQNSYPCGRTGFRLPEKLVRQSDCIVCDKSMIHKMISPLGETVYEGETLVLIKNANKK